MTNERARNRQHGAVDSAPVGAAHEEVLGVREVRDGADTPPRGVVNADPGISKEKLIHLKQIMEDDMNTRTDIGALAGKLMTLG